MFLWVISILMSILIIFISKLNINFIFVLLLQIVILIIFVLCRKEDTEEEVINDEQEPLVKRDEEYHIL